MLKIKGPDVESRLCLLLMRTSVCKSLIAWISDFIYLFIFVLHRKSQFIDQGLYRSEKEEGNGVISSGYVPYVLGVYRIEKIS